MQAEERLEKLESVLIQFIEQTNEALLSFRKQAEEKEAEQKKRSEEREAEQKKQAEEERIKAEEKRRQAEEERIKEKKEWNQRWGDLAKKMGTIVEDIVAPNIPRIAQEYFKCERIDDFMIRRIVRNKKDRTKRREFDVIAVCEDKLIIAESKSNPKKDDIDRFISALNEIPDYFPEYRDMKIIPVMASLNITEDIVNYLTKQNIYAMTMGDETMDIVNFKDIDTKKSDFSA